MAKIAVAFLLVALFAICNGARVARDVPEAPTGLPDFLQTAVDEFKKFATQKNWDEANKQLNKLKADSDKVTGQLSQDFNKFIDSVGTTIKANLPKGN